MTNLLHQKDGWIWINGNFVRWDESKVHILTHGLHYGTGVFEGIRVYNTKPFKIIEHIERLIESANTIGLTTPYTVDELINIIYLYIEKQGIKDGYLRPLIWLGSESLLISTQTTKVHVAIAGWQVFEDKRRYLAENGANINVTLKWRKSPAGCLPYKSKATGLYLILSIIKNEATLAGYDDSLILDCANNITEATTTNFFAIQNDQLITPIADCFLNGITRQTVITIASSINITVVERHVRCDEIAQFDAAFLTGTAAEILPIRSISKDDAVYDLNIKHNILQNIMTEYSNMTKSST